MRLRSNTGVSMNVRRWVLALLGVAAFALLGPGSAPPPAPDSSQAATLASGLQETTVWSGLTNPTVVRFASDGRVFVAEKRGVIKVFDSLTDTTPTTFANLSTNVHDYWDRGLLGMALDPNFPASPYVYVLYTYDHQRAPGAPRRAGGTSAPPRPARRSTGASSAVASRGSLRAATS